MNKINAKQIKPFLIDFLLQKEKSKYDLLVNEAPFLRGNRWADLLAIKKDNLIGFEIKSEADTLKKLSNQISDYLKVFNTVYVVIFEKFKRNADLKSLSKNIGIIIVDKKMNFKVYRKAKIRSKLDKNALISFLWKEDLEKLALNSKYKEVIKLREYVLKNYSLKQIHSKAIRVLKTRYSETYRLFLRDRGNYTTLDDISLITGLKKNLVSLNKSIA